MSTNVEQNPDELREQGNRHLPVADAYQAGAIGDPEWEATFLERAGYGASPLLDANAEKTRSRIAFMTNRSVTHGGVHAAKHSGAATFEGADVDGAGGVSSQQV